MTDIPRKIDLKKELKDYYSPTTKEFACVTVPKMSYIMVDGVGDPNVAESYKQAVEALYALAYTLKFASKRQLGKDYGVMPLEGLWTADDMAAFVARDKASWQWTMMIMQPDWITTEMFVQAVKTVRDKKNPPALDLVRFEAYDEGESVQIMHIGSYDDEAPTLHRLHAEYIPRHGLKPTKRHHEIYLSDPRRTDPSKLKTILRQPVIKA